MNNEMTQPTVKIICKDVLVGLSELPPESVQCVVTSPPYWGFRDYKVDGQIGMESTPEEKEMTCPYCNSPAQWDSKLEFVICTICCARFYYDPDENEEEEEK